MKVEPKQNPRIATEHFFQGAQRIFQTDTASPVAQDVPTSPVPAFTEPFLCGTLTNTAPLNSALQRACVPVWTRVAGLLKPGRHLTEHRKKQ